MRMCPCLARCRAVPLPRQQRPCSAPAAPHGMRMLSSMPAQRPRPAPTWMLARSNSESTLTSTPFSTANSSSLGSLPLPLKMVLQQGGVDAMEWGQAGGVGWNQWSEIYSGRGLPLKFEVGVAAAAGVQSTQQAVGRQGIGHSATHRSRPRLRDGLQCCADFKKIKN